MSEAWKPYLEMIRQKCPDIKYMGLYGHNGVAWCEEGIGASPEEVVALVNAISDPSHAQINGLTIGGNKFAYAKSDEEEGTLIGKAKSSHPSCASGPLTVMKTTQAVVIAYGPNEIQGGQLNMAVMALGDYLKGINF